MSWCAELIRVREEYPKHHKDNLVALVQKETSGNLERVLVACLWTDAENRVRFIHDAVKGAGTDEGALIDVLCTALPSQIRTMKEVWHHHYPLIKMESRLKCEVSGNFQEVIEAVLDKDRPEGGVDAAHMAEDIEAFYKATEGKVGTDEKALAKLVKHRSREHLWAFNEAYKQRSKKGKSAVEVIQAETSGYLERALCAAFMQPAAWYARAIHLSMKGMGTDEHALIRNVFLPFPFELKMAAGVMANFFKAHAFFLGCALFQGADSFVPCRRRTSSSGSRASSLAPLSWPWSRTLSTSSRIEEIRFFKVRAVCSPPFGGPC